jgi:hypothetical protein
MAKSAFNLNAQAPEDDGLELRNISADPAAMPDHLMPRRPHPPAGDRFAATYVSEPDNRRERGRSGRILPRRDTPIPAGTRPGRDEHHDARLHRDPSEVAARRREADAGASDYSGCHALSAYYSCDYPRPVYDGSGASTGMRPEDAERHGRIVPDYPFAFRAEIEEF